MQRNNSLNWQLWEAVFSVSDYDNMPFVFQWNRIMYLVSCHNSRVCDRANDLNDWPSKRLASSLRPKISCTFHFTCTPLQCREWWLTVCCAALVDDRLEKDSQTCVSTIHPFSHHALLISVSVVLWSQWSQAKREILLQTHELRRRLVDTCEDEKTIFCGRLKINYKKNRKFIAIFRKFIKIF